ncbi:Hsp20 family protein [uncultured Buchnera sp.]|jgi:molecular chaperone IbpA|uniref:Hsp20 family protein n=1 Tax=uncultured Buchnera sp. TaxID=574037 RepID=UPI0025E48FE4|nr:Hsp20 family protein [uncultured Buchnera sp.]
MSYRSFSFLPNINQNSVFSNRFNKIDKIFSTLTGEKPLSDIPMYDLFQIDEHKYELTLSIPGYEEKELDISVHNSQLIVQGKKQNEKNNNKTKKYLHKSIILNDFSLNFNFDHKIQVKKAELSLGLLKIDFECKVPDEEKPKKIFINIPSQVTEIEKK